MARAWIGAALLLAWSAWWQPADASTYTVYTYFNTIPATAVSCLGECAGGAISNFVSGSVYFDFDASNISGTFEISPNGGPIFAYITDILGGMAVGSITLSAGQVTAWSLSGFANVLHAWSTYSSSNLGDAFSFTFEYFSDTSHGYLIVDGAGPPSAWAGPTVYNDSVQTPLPSTLPLFASGAVALSLSGWRKRRQGQAATNRSRSGATASGATL